jgi:hypothetical protein
LRVIIEQGKFHGVIAPHTPIAQRFRERLALLGGQDQCEVFAVRRDQVEPFAQHVGALLGREFRPGRERAFGGFHRLRRFRRAHDRHLGEFHAVDRVCHRP